MITVYTLVHKDVAVAKHIVLTYASLDQGIVEFPPLLFSCVVAARDVVPATSALVRVLVLNDGPDLVAFGLRSDGLLAYGLRENLGELEVFVDRKTDQRVKPLRLVRAVEDECPKTFQSQAQDIWGFEQLHRFDGLLCFFTLLAEPLTV